MGQTTRQKIAKLAEVLDVDSIRLRLRGRCRLQVQWVSLWCLLLIMDPRVRHLDHWWKLRLDLEDFTSRESILLADVLELIVSQHALGTSWGRLVRNRLRWLLCRWLFNLEGDPSCFLGLEFFILLLL